MAHASLEMVALEECISVHNFGGHGLSLMNLNVVTPLGSDYLGSTMVLCE